MPEITKAGLLLGGSYGEGALRVNGTTVGYWSVAAASFGLQAGVQKTSQALFFMTTNALERFRRADGWELGAGAEVTVPKDGLTLEVNTTVTNKPVIAMTFGQDGFMAGVSFEGAKYSPIVR
jgi:lipid-binding SYLF domain-containing protein